MNRTGLLVVLMVVLTFSGAAAAGEPNENDYSALVSLMRDLETRVDRLDSEAEAIKSDLGALKTLQEHLYMNKPSSTSLTADHVDYMTQPNQLGVSGPRSAFPKFG